MKSLSWKKIFVPLGHGIVLVLLFLSWWPLARIFYQAKTPIGCDTSNFVYYTLYFRNNPAFPISGWKYQAFEGMPRLLDSTWLHFYLIQPLVSLLGIWSAVKLYPVIFLFLFLVFSYFLFYEVSRNHLLSAGLTLLLSRTGAVYIPLYSSGVVLSSLSQTFCPMMLYFLARFVKRNEQKSLYLAALALALGMYTHPGTTAVVAFVAAVFFLVFFSSQKVRFFNVGRKAKIALAFFALTGLIGALAILPHTYTKLAESGHQWMEFNVEPELKTFSFLYSSLNPVIFLAIMVALVVALIFIKNINRLTLPFFIISGYLLFFLWTLYLGRNPLGGFIFPHRIFWALVVALLVLIAALASPENREKFGQRKKIVYWVFASGFLPLLLVGSLLVPLKEVFNFMGEWIFTVDRLEPQVADPAQVYGGQFLPLTGIDLSFFEGADLNYRFYTIDYAQNLSLAIATPLPQVRGGFHFSTGRNVDWFAWVDAVLGQESQTKERIDPYVAEQQSLFFLDWYAIRYLFSWPAQPGELAFWFFEKDRPYVEERKAKGEDVMIKIKEEFTSPIAKPTNAKVIGFIGSKQGYDSFLRNLGILAYHSQFIIPIRAGEYLEEVREKDLRNFDGLFIYSYREKNKEAHLQAWEEIRKFVNDGGVVLVDTGSYSPEKYLDVLPEIFPVKRITSGPIGSDWLAYPLGSGLFASLDFSQLSPLTYEGGLWTVGYAESVRSGAQAALSVGDKIVVAGKQVGSGKFFWSGLNFPYRTHYFDDNAENEAKIFKSFLDKVFEVEKESLSSFASQRPQSERVIVSGSQAKGVLFKENNYGGWGAKVVANGLSQKLKIYPAGPEFMYVKLPEEIGRSTFEVIFEYQGKPENWLFLVLTIVGLAFVFDGLVLNHKTVRMMTVPFAEFLGRFRGRLGGWWNQDEEV